MGLSHVTAVLNSFEIKRQLWKDWASDIADDLDMPPTAKYTMLACERVLISILIKPQNSLNLMRRFVNSYFLHASSFVNVLMNKLLKDDDPAGLRTNLAVLNRVGLFDMSNRLISSSQSSKSLFCIMSNRVSEDFIVKSAAHFGNIVSLPSGNIDSEAIVSNSTSTKVLVHFVEGASGCYSDDAMDNFQKMRKENAFVMEFRNASNYYKFKSKIE
jgi:hypothetical protein